MFSYAPYNFYSNAINIYQMFELWFFFMFLLFAWVRYSLSFKFWMSEWYKRIQGCCLLKFMSISRSLLKQILKRVQQKCIVVNPSCWIVNMAHLQLTKLRVTIIMKVCIVILEKAIDLEVIQVDEFSYFSS